MNFANKHLSPRHHGQSNYMAYLNKEQYEYRKESVYETEQFYCD